MPTDITIGQVLSIASPVVVAIGFIWKGLPTFRRWTRFLDHVEGVPATRGFDAQPGLWDRLKGVEDAVSSSRLEQAALSAQIGGLPCGVKGGGHCWDCRDLTGQVTDLTGQVSALTKQVTHIVDVIGQLLPNGGSTLRDAIGRIEQDTAAAAGRALPHTTDNPGGTP